MASLATLGPNHHDHAAIEEADRLETPLAIVGAGILSGQRVAIENDRGILKGKPALGKSGVPLGLVKGDFHEDICNYKNIWRQLVFVVTFTSHRTMVFAHNLMRDVWESTTIALRRGVPRVSNKRDGYP